MESKDELKEIDIKSCTCHIIKNHIIKTLIYDILWHL